MKALILFMLCSCFTAVAQEHYYRFVAEGGARVPLDKMAGKVGISPEAGLWFRSRIEHQDYLDIGMSVYVPVNRREFIYNAPDTIYRTKATIASGMAGVRFCKEYVVGFNRTFEWVSTFGYAWFLYKDKQAHAQHQDDGRYRNYSKALSTFHVGQGVRYTVNNVGLQVNYQYTPYALFSSYVPRDFGAHSLTVAIIYKQ